MSTSRWAARPRNWAATAAAIAVMVCGAIWPLPVVGAGGALVAAVAIAHGIRAFRTEQRTEPAARPDPSGPDPETTRTDPDTTGRQPADQPGPDPDHTLPPLTTPGRVLTAAMVRDAMSNASYCPHCGRGDLAPTADDWAQQAARAVAAEAAITRVRELHAKWKHGESSPNTYCKHCEVDNDVVRYPCATIRALDAVPAEGSSR